MRSLTAIMADLGHTGKALTYLKFDAEGAEREVLPDMVASVQGNKDLLPRQIGVELHWPAKLEYLTPLISAGYILAGRRTTRDARVSGQPSSAHGDICGG